MGLPGSQRRDVAEQQSAAGGSGGLRGDQDGPGQETKRRRPSRVAFPASVTGKVLNGLEIHDSSCLAAGVPPQSPAESPAESQQTCSPREANSARAWSVASMLAVWVSL